MKPVQRDVVISAVVLIGLTVAGLWLVEGLIGFERIDKIVEDSGALAPLAFIVLKASTYVIAPLSGSPLAIAAGTLFGFGPGIIYILIGDVIGAAINYWIGSTLGRLAVAKFSGKKNLAKIESFSNRLGGIKALIFARVVLSSVYDFISYGAGLAHIPFRQFVLVTAVAGIIPVTLTTGFGALYRENPKLLLVTYLVLAVVVTLLLFVWKRLNTEQNL